jgi:hypothetical protein
MPQWLRFPPEIRLMVLEILVQDPNDKQNGKTSTKTGWVRYAAVCKEWQAFFEDRLYRSLALTPSCLEAFGQFVCRQRRLVEHFWLRIELGTYGCNACRDFNPPVIDANDNEIIAKAISKLWLILSTWHKPQVASQKKLV